MTLTWLVPAPKNAQDKDAVPGPVVLTGLTLHDVLLVARATTPANPFALVTVIDEVPAEPALTVTLVGDAEIAKS